jgi:uncharacterized protein YlxP (DUF503 family)
MSDMVVGICKLSLSLPVCGSLKEKRGVVKRLKDRTLNTFSVPVSEVGMLDKWQRSIVGFAVVGNDRRHIEGLVQKIGDFIEGLGMAQIVDVYTEFINV